MRWARNVARRERREKCTTFWSESPKERDHSEDRGERWQNKNSRLIVNADWYIRSNQINKETDILPVSEEVRNHSRR
jgi:hypothetical protein